MVNMVFFKLGSVNCKRIIAGLKFCLLVALCMLVLVFLISIVNDICYADCLYDGTCIWDPNTGKIIYKTKYIPIDNPFDENLWNIQTINGKQCVEICYIEKKQAFCKMYPIELYRVVINLMAKAKQEVTVYNIDTMYTKIIEEYNRRNP